MDTNKVVAEVCKKEDMEKISAACAKEWSIQLEKGLRSKNRGQAIEAILQFGTKLQQWSREPHITMAISNIFGLVPGEDRLFANTILLRLADAFRSGDNHMRASILKIFLLELRHRRKCKIYNGLLVKERVPNYLELLRRVKIVFDTGDVESRALALRLFGCWADLAKDSAHIRYLILSCLESCHILEVKASLFAASCFCELSEDFASAVLESLINLTNSSNTSSDVKHAAVRVFAKMGSSYFVASKAYKAGQKLMLNSSEDLMVEMLSSLSKLASKSFLLIPEQVELLLSILGRESVSPLTVKAMKFLRFLSVRLVSRFPINADSLMKLFLMLDNSECSLNMQCDALRVLRKIFCCGLPSFRGVAIPEIVKIVLIVEDAAQSPSPAKRFLAFGLLVDISCNLERRHDQLCSANSARDVVSISDGNDPSVVPGRVALLLTHQLSSVMKQVKDGANVGGLSSTLKQEFHLLLNLTLRLVEQHPLMGLTTLCRIQCLVNTLVKARDTHGEVTGMDVDPTSPSHAVCGSTLFEGKVQIPNSTQLLLQLCSFSGACLQIIDEAGAVTNEVHDVVTSLVEHIWQSGLLKHMLCSVISLHYHSHLMFHFRNYESDMTSNIDKYGSEVMSASYNNCWVEHEKLTLEFAKQLLTTTDFWGAYKTGKYAACEGAWFSATFIFGLLMKKGKSGTYGYWLKSLALLAGAQSEILLLLYPNFSLELINGLQQIKGDHGAAGEVNQGVNESVDLCDYGRKLTRAYSRICSAGKMLGDSKTSVRAHYFQRWFISLRAKFLEVLLDLFALLNLETFDKQGLIEKGGSSPEVLGQLTGLSVRLHRLAKEYDLLATSFMNIDCKSFRSISSLALNCSLLAFCTAHAQYFPNRSSEKSEKNSPAVLIQDLVERLWYIDRNLCTDLQTFLTQCGELRGLVTHCRTQISSSGHTQRAISTVCRFAVMGILQYQQKRENEVNKLENFYPNLKAGMHLLSNIARRLMCIPFQIPKYFFAVRPCIGAELFIFNADTLKSGGISVLLGCHLPLNICIQLKNKFSDQPWQVSKISCVIAAKRSDCLSIGGTKNKEQKDSDFQAWNNGEMVVMNEDLLLFMKGVHRWKRARTGDIGEHVMAFASFELNERGQGFSTCLLDVSSFPTGSYPILWCCCCIDDKGSYWNLLPLNTSPVFTIFSKP